MKNTLLISLAIAELILIAAAFWLSDGICFHWHNLYSYCAIQNHAEAIAEFEKAMPKAKQ